MKKRIFSVLLLSMLLAVGVVSSAMAASTPKYTFSKLEADNTDVKVASGGEVEVTITGTYTYAASGGSTTNSNPAISWSVENSLGLSLTNQDTEAGTVSGTFAATLKGKPSGNGDVVVSANLAGTDKNVTVSITILSAPTFKTSATLPAMKAGTDFSTTIELNETITALGDECNWSISDSDVETLAKYGLALEGTDKTDQTSVTLTGTPTQSATALSFTLTASNDVGSKSQKFTMAITGKAPQFATWMPGDGNDMGIATTNKSAATNAILPLFFRNGVLVKGRSVASIHPSNLVVDGETTNDTSFDIVVYGTLPITLKVENLPDGLKATQVSGDKNALLIGASQEIDGVDYAANAAADDADTSTTIATYDGTNGFVWTRITGAPSKVGVYKKVKVTATNNDGSVSRTFTIDVTAIPEVATKEAKATWGKALKTTLKANNVNKLHPMTWHVSFDETSVFTQLPEGLSLDKSTGALTGTYDSKDQGRVFTGTEKTATFTVPIFVSNDAGSSDITDLKITMALAKPVIVNKKTLKLPEMTVGTEITPFSLDVSGGGIMSWTVSDDAPDGIIVTQSDDYTLWFRGKPKVGAKGQSAKYTIANAAGNDSITLKFNITVDHITFPAALYGVEVGSDHHYHNEDTSFTGTDSSNSYRYVDGGLDATTSWGTVSDYAVGDEVEIQLHAQPGPITWSAKNLPAGITLSADKNGGTDAWLVGKFTKPTKLDKDGRSIYYVTATNKLVSDKSKGVITLSADLRVFAAPEITTKKLSALTTGKKYTAKIAVKNVDPDNLIVVASIDKSGTGATGTLMDDNPEDDGTQFATFSLGVNEEKYYLTFSRDIMTIYGSLDRIPPDGKFYVSIGAKNAAGEAVVDNIPVDVKGQAPKLLTTKIDDFTSGTAGDVIIKTSGTQPITLNAYIDNKTAKAYGLVASNSTASVDLGGRLNEDGVYVASDDNNKTGFVFLPRTVEVTVGDSTYYEPVGSGDLVFSGDKASYKGIPITFVATNPASTKPTTKAVKVNVEGADPELWYTPLTVANDGTREVAALADMVLMSRDITVYASGGTLEELTFLGSGDKPVVITAKGDKNGVTSTVSEDNASAVTIQGSGIKTDKESKTVITVTATNPSTKKKVARKVTVIQLLKPTITTKDKGLTKEVELGKKLSLKLSAKGSKTILWSVDQAAAASLDLIGLSLDATKGVITGTPTAPTSDDTHKLYQPFEFKVRARNGAGIDEVPVKVGVKGKKPKLVTKTLTVSQDAGELTVDNSTYKVFTNISSSDATAYLVFSGLSVNGLSFGNTSSATHGSSPYNEGVIVGNPSKATKGTSAKIKITNLGTEITANVKVIIRDKAPEINTPDTISIAAKEKEKATGTATLSLSAGAPTDGTTVKWKLTGKPTTKGVSVKLTDNKNNTATITVTVPKAFTGVDEDTYEVTATNSATKLSATVEGTITVEAAPVTEDESALPDDESALPDEEAAETETETEGEEAAETETESEETATEGEIALGTARTEAQLTAEQRAFLEKNGYVIAAILPEMSVTADRQYDIDVELNENAPEGAELVWFAFPSTTTTDDDIVDFYDEAGASVEGVPASHKIIASPWLNEGVTYAPVIAVKTVNAGGARDTLEGAEEGAVVTEEALETAAAPAE